MAGGTALAIQLGHRESIDGVKLSFFYYEYRLLFPLIDFENINLADARDISAMKIDAISSRGSKKDFIDIYFLMKKYGLPDIIDFFMEKYSEVKYNKLHILKSLNYFEDAEKEPELRMIKKLIGQK